MGYFNFDPTKAPVYDAAYGQGVEDGARQERERIVTALLGDRATAEAAGLYLSHFALLPDFYRTDPEYKQMTDDLAAGVVQAACDHIGLGAVTTEESEK